MKRQNKRGKKTAKPERKFLWRALVAVAVLAAGAGAVMLYSYFTLQAPTLPEPPLKDLAAAHNVELGIHAAPNRVYHQPYRDLVTSQFSLITSDGEVHWDKFRRKQNRYEYAKLDRLLDFAEEHDMPVQVHHLVWNEADSLPKWLKEGNYTRDELMDILHDHISNVVGHYKGRVSEWSVVNEAFTRDNHLWGTDNWWGDAFNGDTTYIDNAFRWAHEADPDAKLILNDFYNDVQNFVSDQQYEYMKGAKERGVPIDGVGMQMHIDTARMPKKEDIMWNMQRFAKLGYPTYITEFDISTTFVDGSKEYKQQLEDQAAEVAIDACVESKVCNSFTVFGLTDRNWFNKQFKIGRQRQYLFTSQYEPKTTYQAFRNALLQ